MKRILDSTSNLKLNSNIQKPEEPNKQNLEIFKDLRILDEFLEGVEFKIDFKMEEINFESTGSRLIDQFVN